MSSASEFVECDDGAGADLRDLAAHAEVGEHAFQHARVLLQRFVGLARHALAAFALFKQVQRRQLIFGRFFEFQSRLSFALFARGLLWWGAQHTRFAQDRQRLIVVVVRGHDFDAVIIDARLAAFDAKLRGAAEWARECVAKGARRTSEARADRVPRQDGQRQLQRVHAQRENVEHQTGEAADDGGDSGRRRRSDLM
jgi:hypothetical protein